MRSTAEMTRAVHGRAAALRRRRVASAGAASGALTVALLALIGRLGGLAHRPAAEGFAGASMLSDSAGGYVLAAVLAFMAGVIVAVALIRHRKRETGRDSTEAKHEPHRNSENIRGRKS